LQLKNAWAGVVNAPAPKATVPAIKTSSASLPNVFLPIASSFDAPPQAADIVRCVNAAPGQATSRLWATPVVKATSGRYEQSAIACGRHAFAPMTPFEPSRLALSGTTR